MSVPITALYAGLLALIVIVLGFQVGRARLAKGISILHGNDLELATVIRRHANFTESVPLALLLMVIVELNGGAPGLLHGVGLVLLIGRIIHPLGLKHDQLRNPLRGIGSLATSLSILILAVTALWQFAGAE
jgi:hypothetical protein